MKEIMDSIRPLPEGENQQRILVVDDDTFILETLREGLSLRGYLCETAVDAITALELMGNKPFHGVVIDINLPDMNGFDLTRKVKKSNPDIAVIMMTGSIHDFSYDDAVEAGASDFIKKPFSLKELIVRIGHARKHESLYSLSVRDDLTGLYNRRGFFTLAEHLLKQAKRNMEGFFLIYADLDNLKGMNDTFGHQMGDWALIDVANILKGSFRDSDVIARLGGDEFVVMPIGKRGDNVDLIINRLQQAVDMDNVKSKRQYKLSISMGTAFFDSWAPCSIDELLFEADKSMYRQKKDKTNRLESTC
jgi:diguanylate cyclase (GGDEF)-like protein